MLGALKAAGIGWRYEKAFDKVPFIDPTVTAILTVPALPFVAKLLQDESDCQAEASPPLPLIPIAW
jgi:hypothetical protein